MTVYVVQENPRNDYAPAEEYGEVVFMTADEYSPLKNSLRNEQIVDKIYGCMLNYDPEKDYLVLTGNPVIMGYAVHLAMSRFGWFRYLQWDRFSGGYRNGLFTGDC